jgi:co-chaperonin GroES (HSP10)
MLEPFNRYILVEPVEEEEEESNLAIVLPDSYSKPTSPYVQCEVLSVSIESRYRHSLKSGDKIIIERRMMLSIELENKTTYLVLENYIYGRINNEIE